MEIYSMRALVWKQFRAYNAVKQWGSQGLIRQLMAVSPIRETLTAPWGAINRVALDNNSRQALPPHFPALLLQAKQGNERREVHGGWEQALQHPSASSKSARRLLTLGWTASSKKLLRKVIILWWWWWWGTNKFRLAGQGNWRAQ